MGFIIRGFIWDIPIPLSLFLLMCFFRALVWGLGDKGFWLRVWVSEGLWCLRFISLEYTWRGRGLSK